MKKETIKHFNQFTLKELKALAKLQKINLKGERTKSGIVEILANEELKESKKNIEKTKETVDENCTPKLKFQKVTFNEGDVKNAIKNLKKENKLFEVSMKEDCKPKGEGKITLEIISEEEYIDALYQELEKAKNNLFWANTALIISIITVIFQAIYIFG